MESTFVYIWSINKRISMEEFKGYCQKVGHAYKITDAYLEKCVGYDDNCTPIIESITILPELSDGGCQVIIDENSLPMPSLDFVNGLLEGKYKEIDVEEYDRVRNFIKSHSSMMYNYINKLIE